MSTEDLEKYETEMELQLYREYRDIVRQFTYVVETERRFYLANSVDLQVREAGGEVYFELKLSDAWVWDMYRPARFVAQRAGADVQGRQRRGAGQARPRAAGRTRACPDRQSRTPAAEPGCRRSTTDSAAVHDGPGAVHRRLGGPGAGTARCRTRSTGAAPQRPTSGPPLGARHLRRARSPPPTSTDAGLRVLDRNWRCREGELDIVARDGDALVFCEVKTRRGVGYGHPVEAVTAGQAAAAAPAGAALAGRARRARARPAVRRRRRARAARAGRRWSPTCGRRSRDARPHLVGRSGRRRTGAMVEVEVDMAHGRARRGPGRAARRRGAAVGRPRPGRGGRTPARRSRSGGSPSGCRRRRCRSRGAASTWRSPPRCWPPPARCRAGSVDRLVLLGRARASTARSAASAACCRPCSPRPGPATAQVVVPAANADEAALVDGIEVLAGDDARPRWSPTSPAGRR